VRIAIEGQSYGVDYVCSIDHFTRSVTNCANGPTSVSMLAGSLLRRLRTTGSDQDSRSVARNGSDYSGVSIIAYARVAKVGDENVAPAIDSYSNWLAKRLGPLAKVHVASSGQFLAGGH
jgi:hypothetical protein